MLGQTAQLLGIAQELLKERTGLGRRRQQLVRGLPVARIEFAIDVSRQKFAMPISQHFMPFPSPSVPVPRAVPAEPGATDSESYRWAPPGSRPSSRTCGPPC